MLILLKLCQARLPLLEPERDVFRGMVRKRAIGDGQLRDLEQHYIQAIYRYNEALDQSPHCASKARREMVRLEVEVRRLRYGY